ncbi:hypothetical protein TEA_000521 [Camellia sinensis var. sinensis]|uniref:Uncharacterized protein n=1 Tax=Camellia sinensis var. sinensis TaxID=542762 RepID=A0A4V3WJA3_CAMSN|nr:hypothetical protein TEA_000521 [Camellia sinensis var. sinensis]
MTQKVNVKKSSLTSGSAELNRNNDHHAHQSDVDDKPVIDKTVVMLECEKPSFPIVHPSQENMGVQKERYDNHDNLEKTDVMSEYAAIRAPASPMEGVDIEPIQSQLQEQPRVYEGPLVQWLRLGLITLRLWFQVLGPPLCALCKRLGNEYWKFEFSVFNSRGFPILAFNSILGYKKIHNLSVNGLKKQSIGCNAKGISIWIINFTIALFYYCC